MKSQAAYRPGAGERLPNTQRGALRRGAGSHCHLNQYMASRQTPAQECRVSDPNIDAMIGDGSPSTGMNKTCAGRNWFELLVQPVTLPNVEVLA